MGLGKKSILSLHNVKSSISMSKLCGSASYSKLSNEQDSLYKDLQERLAQKEKALVCSQQDKQKLIEKNKNVESQLKVKTQEIGKINYKAIQLTQELVAVDKEYQTALEEFKILRSKEKNDESGRKLATIKKDYRKALEEIEILKFKEKNNESARTREFATMKKDYRKALDEIEILKSKEKNNESAGTHEFATMKKDYRKALDEIEILKSKEKKNESVRTHEFATMKKDYRKALEEIEILKSKEKSDKLARKKEFATFKNDCQETLEKAKILLSEVKHNTTVKNDHLDAMEDILRSKEKRDGSAQTGEFARLKTDFRSAMDEIQNLRSKVKNDELARVIELAAVKGDYQKAVEEIKLLRSKYHETAYTQELATLKRDYQKALEEIKILKSKVLQSECKITVTQQKKEIPNKTQKGLVKSGLPVDKVLKKQGLECPIRCETTESTHPYYIKLLQKKNFFQKELRKKQILLMEKDDQLREKDNMLKTIVEELKRIPFQCMDGQTERPTVMEYYRIIQEQKEKIKIMAAHLDMHQSVKKR